MGTEIRWSDENIKALLRKLRKDAIDAFLSGELKNEILNTTVIDPKKWFVIGEKLKQHQFVPIDDTFYQSIINAIRQTDTASFNMIDMNLIYEEIRQVISKCS
jgi:hypothetical protein